MLVSFFGMIPSSHLILWCPLLLLSIFPSITDFSNELAVCIRWSKYWSFSFSSSPSSEYSVFISLKSDWFDLLAVHGTFRSLLQHHSSKNIYSLALCVLYIPALTPVGNHQKDHVYLCTLTMCTVVGRVMSLTFNTPSRFIIAFLPKQLSSDFMAAVTICSDFRAQEEICHYLHIFSLYLPWSKRVGCHDLSF